jgi:nucleotide-binding universal stress UspA family protein
MRILLAIDGSPTADRAVELVRSSVWARPTAVRVVTVDESISDLMNAPWLGEPLVDHGPTWSHTRLLHGIAARAVEQISSADLPVEGKVLQGRAADEIVGEALAFGADLIVIGSRGLGTIRTMLLGSVSAEVVDRAPCPVLVARHDRVNGMVIGLDGSPCSERALDFVAEHALFPGAEAIVASAVPQTAAFPTLAPLTGAAIELPADPRLRQAHQEIVLAGVARLRGPIRPVSEAIVEGDPAAELIDVATTHDADLIVVGTRGLTGVRRWFLGSTARNVLLHAACSVLVVRQRRGVRVPAERQLDVRRVSLAVSLI